MYEKLISKSGLLKLGYVSGLYVLFEMKTILSCFLGVCRESYGSKISRICALNMLRTAIITYLSVQI